jgi:HAD superfamily hydrolase (TIGR01459 family)
VNATQLIDGIGGIAGDYDLFLLDQWGVLHNGETAHPDAVSVLRRLHEAGQRVVLISNSSKPSANSIANLTRMGIDRELYADVVTSGEIAWREMKAGTDPFFGGLGRRCYMFTWGGDRSFIAGLPYEEVATVDEADFLLLSGTSGATISIYEDALQAGIARGLPMICLNRDFVAVDPAGNLVECSGMVARRYEALGGTVRYYGKPGRAIYEACLALAPGARRPIGIGDSLHHDIEGGRVMGIDTVFVTGGIHAFDLGIRPGEKPAQAALRKLYEEQGVWPDYAMAGLAW